KAMETRIRGNTSTGEKFDDSIPNREGSQPPESRHDVTEIFSEHAEFVWRSLKRLRIPVLDIDDALEEVFLVVYRRVADYEDRGMMRAWLFSISRQIARHYHRSAGRTENRLRRLVLEPSPPNAEEAMALREAEDLVAKFLDELDENHR